VASTVLVGHSLHVHGLNKLHLVHEAGKWVGPALGDSLQVSNLVKIDVEHWHGSGSLLLIISWGSDKGLKDKWILLGSDNLVVTHVLKNLLNALVEGLVASVDVEIAVGWGLIWRTNASEVLDLTSTGLLVHTLWISLLANLKGSADMALNKLKTSSIMDSSSCVTVLGSWGNEGHKDDKASHVEELGDLTNAADVLSAILWGEAKTLVQSGTDDITIKDVDSGLVAQHFVEFLFDGLRKSGLTGAG